MNLDALGLVTVGTVVAQAGDVNILGDDLDLLGSVTGAGVSITNRSGGNAVTVVGDASAPGAFAISQLELDRIDSSVLTIDSLDQNLLVGNVVFDNDVGTTRVNLLGTARIAFGIDARPISAQLGLERLPRAAVVLIDLTLRRAQLGGELERRRLARRRGRCKQQGQANEARN